MNYLNDIKDHPEIQWIEETGYPSWMQEDNNIEYIESLKETEYDKMYEEKMNEFFDKNKGE